MSQSTLPAMSVADNKLFSQIGHVCKDVLEAMLL